MESRRCAGCTLWLFKQSTLVVLEKRNPLKYIYLIILSSQVLFLEARYAHFLSLMSVRKAGYSVYEGISHQFSYEYDLLLVSCDNNPHVNST